MSEWPEVQPPGPETVQTAHLFTFPMLELALKLPHFDICIITLLENSSHHNCNGTCIYETIYTNKCISKEVMFCSTSS